MADVRTAASGTLAAALLVLTFGCAQPFSLTEAGGQQFARIRMAA